MPPAIVLTTEEDVPPSIMDKPALKFLAKIPARGLSSPAAGISIIVKGVPPFNSKRV